MNALLQVGGLPPDLIARLDADFQREVLPAEPERAAFLAARGGDFVAAVTSGTTGVSGEVMRALPALRVIANLGVGYDTTDVATARELGIAVSNTPDVLTDAVADVAVGLVIDAVRGISAADRFVRRGAWPDGPMPLRRDLRGMNVGVLGLGRIGRAIGARLEPFGVRLGYHNRRVATESSYAYFDTALALAEWADVLIVATSGGADSRGLVSAGVLAALGPQGYLVNIARGTVIDEPALIEALSTGKLGGAALDVFVAEPHVPAQLLDLDNVTLLPHIGSATVETRTAMADLVHDNLRAFFATGALLTPV